jgi:hypothetical protein
VKLYFAGPDAEFEGSLQSDRETLIGTTQFGEVAIPTELRRTGEAQFSSMFLELEAASDDSTLVQRLPGNASALREQFNADAKRVRLLLLLSPT